MPEILEIPIELDDASFSIRTVLENTTVILRFDWNGREERWSISFYDEVETPLVMGLVLNIDMELISRFEIPKLPPGKMVLFDTGLTHVECGRNDLGKRCKLIYQTSV